jgi:hypothetical protein
VRTTARIRHPLQVVFAVIGEFDASAHHVASHSLAGQHLAKPRPGEVEVGGDDIAGLAVTIAKRVCDRVATNVARKPSPCRLDLAAAMTAQCRPSHGSAASPASR